jgi:aspartate/methionine/tyrosine aminotransferase
LVAGALPRQSALARRRPTAGVAAADSVTFSEKLLQEERVAPVPGNAFRRAGEG